MPLVRINRIVIDLLWCAEGLAAVCAARKHHISCVSPGRNHTGQHVNVIVSRTTGAINRQETLPGQSVWIDSPATEVAAHVDSGASVKSWRLAPDLRIARALAKECAESFPTDKQVAIGVHVERSVYRRVRNTNRRLPGDPAVGGTLKFHAAAATVNAVVCLVLEAMPGAVGLIDGEPLLVASAPASLAR